jgi:Na+/melibiose symporter-like transporter
MGIGTSIFMIAVGAILKFAVTTSVTGISLQTVGVILMIVGVIGLIISLLWLAIWSDRSRGTAPTVRDRYIERDPLV